MLEYTVQTQFTHNVPSNSATKPKKRTQKFNTGIVSSSKDRYKEAAILGCMLRKSHLAIEALQSTHTPLYPHLAHLACVIKKYFQICLA